MRTRTKKVAKMDFETWKNAVNAEVLRQTGMGADDLPDYKYRDAYDAGKGAKSVASSAVKAARREMGY